MKDKQSLPTTASFHPETIDKWVNKKILTGNPVTIFTPVAGLIAAGGGFALSLLIEPWMIGVALGSIGVGFGSLLFDSFVRKDSIRMGYLSEANKQLELQAQQLAEWLKNEFQELGDSQALGLVGRLESHTDAFENVLQDKFQVGTETYEHFHGVAEALLNQTLNILKDVASQIKVNQAVDLQNAPQSVVEGHRKGEERLETLLASAESAVAGIAELNQKVAAISSGSPKDLSDFLQDVEVLAERTKLYIDERTL